MYVHDTLIDGLRLEVLKYWLVAVTLEAFGKLFRLRTPSFLSYLYGDKPSLNLLEIIWRALRPAQLSNSPNRALAESGRVLETFKVILGNWQVNCKYELPQPVAV
jgi:hypothetical protein